MGISKTQMKQQLQCDQDARGQGGGSAGLWKAGSILQEDAQARGPRHCADVLRWSQPGYLGYTADPKPDGAL